VFLFKVQDRYLISGRGLILIPGLGDKKATIGDPIKIVKPDHTIIKTTIRGIGFNEFRDVLIGKDLSKEDVPIDSEIWLDKE
jgi:hypothetical protein